MGGAAGLNSVRIARRLGCARLLIPEVGAALSAAGATMSDLKNEYRAGQFATTVNFDYVAVAAILAGLERQCRSFIVGPGAGALESEISYKVDARYATQVWEIEVPLHLGRISNPAELAAFVADFHKTHDDLFAFADPQSAIEIIGWSAQVSCRFNETVGLRLAPAVGVVGSRHSRRAYFASVGWVEVPVHQFGAIGVGELLVGPAIVESSFTTVVLDTGAVATRRPSGSLSITLESYIMNQPESERVLDGVKLAILNNRLEGIARKMANTLMRTGRSGVLNSARDFSCCILTADSELLVANEALPIHTLSGPDMMARVMKEFHPDLKRGDAFLNNSPYHGGSHAADHTLLVPVMDDQGRHRLTVSCKAHQADIGNSIPTTYHGTAKDVYEEGALIFPSIKVQDNYEINADIVRMCRMRIRVPDQWWGDFLAMVGPRRCGRCGRPGTPRRRRRGTSRAIRRRVCWW